MTKMNIYVVYDLKAEESGKSFEAKNDAVALRMYQDLMSKTKYPEEFQLRCLGSIDHETDLIQPFLDGYKIILWPEDPENMEVIA